MFPVRLLSVLFFLTLCFSCTGPDSSPATTEQGNATQNADPRIDPERPFQRRTNEGIARLRATPAGTLVAEAIGAHGGLESWYGMSPLYYRFNYRPTEADKTIRDSYILNDYVNARAVHTSATEEGVTYGFDGRDAWKAPAGAEISIKPRFWSLTPYYFVGLPFVLADEGINFEQLSDTTRAGTNYHRVKVTYDAGVGDAAGDYYVLWLHPETKQLDALNYIVSYPGFFPDGGHLPEKLMVLSGKTTVNGIVLPTGYTTRWSSAPDEVITNITVSEHAFRPDTPASAFDRPDNAETVE